MYPKTLIRNLSLLIYVLRLLNWKSDNFFVHSLGTSAFGLNLSLSYSRFKTWLGLFSHCNFATVTTPEWPIMRISYQAGGQKHKKCNIVFLFREFSGWHQIVTTVIFCIYHYHWPQSQGEHLAPTRAVSHITLSGKFVSFHMFWFQLWLWLAISCQPLEAGSSTIPRIRKVNLSSSFTKSFSCCNQIDFSNIWNSRVFGRSNSDPTLLHVKTDIHRKMVTEMDPFLQGFSPPKSDSISHIIEDVIQQGCHSDICFHE